MAQVVPLRRALLLRLTERARGRFVPGVSEHDDRVGRAAGARRADPGVQHQPLRRADALRQRAVRGVLQQRWGASRSRVSYWLSRTILVGSSPEPEGYDRAESQQRCDPRGPALSLSPTTTETTFLPLPFARTAKREHACWLSSTDCVLRLLNNAAKRANPPRRRHPAGEVVEAGRVHVGGERAHLRRRRHAVVARPRPVVIAVTLRRLERAPHGRCSSSCI